MQTIRPTVENKNLYRDTFESWGEFMERMEQQPLSGIRGSDDNSMQPKWYGTKSFQDAYLLGTKGWQQGVNMAHKLSGELVQEIVGKVYLPEIEFDVIGSDYDLDAYLKGEPECWYRFVTSEQTAPSSSLISILINCTTSGSNTAKQMLMKYIPVVALVELLEYAGKRVQVDCVASIDSGWGAGSQHSEMLVRLKEYGYPLDLQSIAFGIAHPSMLRRFFFRWCETIPEAECRRLAVDGGSYGMPSSCRLEKDYDLYIGQTYGRWDEAASRKWVIDQLKAYGVAMAE